MKNRVRRGSRPTTTVFVTLQLACASTPATIAPEGLAPTDREVVEAWISDFTPHQSREYSIRPWRFRNEKGAAAGRATVKIAPPDSLRFDYRGPLRRNGRAAMVGDSTLWVEPEDEFGGLVGVAPIFWAALGLPLLPPRGPVLSFADDETRAWRYVVEADTFDFVVRGDPAHTMLAELRRDGQMFARATVELDPDTGWVVSSRIDFPASVSRFEFKIEGVDTQATFERRIWENR